MPTTILFPDGTEIKIEKRSDYKDENVQMLLRAHKLNRDEARCMCRSDIELMMLIARVPKPVDETLPDEDSGLPNFTPSSEIVPTPEKEREMYLKRKAQTSHLHAEGCPNVLRLRDSTAANRGERKFPLSIFGPPRQSASRSFEVRSGGSITGRNLRNFAAFCSLVIYEAAHSSSLLAGTPFGTPSLQMLFNCILEHLRESKDLEDQSLNPFEAAKAKKCRLEYGLCEYSEFGSAIPIGSGLVTLPITIADEFGNLRFGSYLMNAKIYRAAAKQVRRHQFYIKPPYIWMGIISGANRIVRFWQWPVVVYNNQILLRDSDPEAEFALEALWQGNAVYKVKSLENANKLLRLLVPEAGPILSECDYITWNGRIAVIVEVVKSDETKRKYWLRLGRKEIQKGGYLDLRIKNKLYYLRADMRFQLGLGRKL